MKPFCFANNQVISAEQAAIHPLDIGLIRGYAIFDFLRTEDFQPLFLGGYLDRFISSAEKLNLPLKYDQDELKNIIYALIKKNELQQGGIRMILSGGVSENHFSPSLGTLFIFCEELTLPSPDKYEQGVKLLSEEYIRPLASIKTTNYTLPVWLSKNWKEMKAEDVLYHHGGIISESSRSNIFMVKNGIVSTPKLNILYGITRKNVIALADKVEEREISLTEILNADEAFITSTTKRILPVTQVDGTLIGSGRPGEITRLLMERFQELEQKEKAPAG